MPEESPGSCEPNQDPNLSRPDHSGEGHSAAPCGGSSNPGGESTELLSQILHRLQRMEGGLSQHEQWLRRIEEEQRAGEPDAGIPGDGEQSGDELRRLVGSLTMERDRARRELTDAQQELGRYQQELLNLRQQVTDLHGQLAERDQELAGLKNSATKDNQQARSLQTEAQRQIQARQQQLVNLQNQLAAAREQLGARDSQIDNLQLAIQEAAERFESFSAEALSHSAADRTWSRFAKVAIVLAFASAAGSVGLTGWLYQRGPGMRPQTVSATLLLPGTDAQAFAAIVDRAEAEDKLRIRPDPQLRTIELLLETEDTAAGISRLDALAEHLTSAAKPLSTPAIAPADRGEAEAITAGLARIQQQLAAADTSGGLQDEQALPSPAELSTGWSALRRQRDAVSEKMDELSRAMEAAQAQTPAEVTAEQIARAEAADRQLQSEAEAYQQREEQLAGRLRVSIDTATLQYQALQQALTEADEHLQKAVQEDQPEQVNANLTAIRDSLKTWARALTELETAWKRQRGMLDSPGGADALAAQSELEKSARAFVNEITTADAEYARAIEAIGQGQDQTTKRLVLRNSLVKQLAPANTAQQAVAMAARAVILTENVELAAIVQRLDALRKQSQQRRAQIAAALRQEQLAAVQKQQTQQIARARTDHQELAKQAAEIDRLMADLGDRLTAAAGDHAERLAASTARADLLELQAREMGKLLGIHERFTAQVASLPPPPTPGYLGARVVSAQGGSTAGWSALLLGSTPALVCAALLAMCWLVISSRRSQQTIEEYARTLKETARRASLAEQPQNTTSDA